MKHTIAIDGHAASGKSSAAKKVAKKLEFAHLDSGRLYRAITYALNAHNLANNPESEEAKKLIKDLKIDWDFGKIKYQGKDITECLQTHEIDSKVAGVAKLPYVREKVHEIQYEIIDNSTTGIVVDGRDIGTVVLPNAFLKIFVTASAETRAKRRVAQNGCNYEEVLKTIRERDHKDETRVHGPLKVADDAIKIENDNLTLDETVTEIIKHYKEKLNKL